MSNVGSGFGAVVDVEYSSESTESSKGRLLAEPRENPVSIGIVTRAISYSAVFRETPSVRLKRYIAYGAYTRRDCAIRVKSS